jgi:hypothetical protein
MRFWFGVGVLIVCSKFRIPLATDSQFRPHNLRKLKPLNTPPIGG